MASPKRLLAGPTAIRQNVHGPLHGRPNAPGSPSPGARGTEAARPAAEPVSDVLVVGTGLLGTSLGLALAGQVDVTLHDAATGHLAAAAAMGAGRRWDGIEPARLVIVAVPPSQISSELIRLQRLAIASTYSHVGSLQTHVQHEVETYLGQQAAMLGCHPLAGKEMSGPTAAESSLFVGRRWAVCPWPASSDQSINAVLDLARACGAEPVLVEPAEHDAAVALSSHLPHLTSALLAGLLPGSPTQALVLAGPGLVDMTRLAAGDPELWREILTLNASQVSDLARLLGQRLLRVGDLLDADDGTGLVELLELGRQGRAQLPIKRGLQDAGFRPVTVVLQDAPGQLAALLAAAAAEGVNVEDVRVEHAVDGQSGRVGLWVAGRDHDRLRVALVIAGWTAIGM